MTIIKKTNLAVILKFRLTIQSKNHIKNQKFLILQLRKVLLTKLITVTILSVEIVTIKIINLNLPTSFLQHLNNKNGITKMIAQKLTIQMNGPCKNQDLLQIFFKTKIKMSLSLG